MNLNRRESLRLLCQGTAAIAAASSLSNSLPSASASPIVQPPRKEETSMAPFAERIRYCLNTSTVRGQKLSVPDQIRVCSVAGYDAIEPWIGDLRGYAEQGGSLADLRKQLDDSGITVESAIGFAHWIVDDADQRKAGLEEAKRDMDLLAQIGGKRIAAPPIGAHQMPGPDLGTIAARYRDLLVVGAQTGVTPQLELWGFSKTLSRLGELAYVAVEAGHPDACVLPDVYHIYKGGSDFAGLGMIEASKMHVFHMNDYPANPPRESIADRHRVFPGDGVAPIEEIFTLLAQNGFNGVVSLELFNEDYWSRPAEEVAKEGLEKMRATMSRVTA